MEERLSILEEEKFAECRLCNHLVSSLNPICKNCGLEMSREGIIELAEIEEIDAEIENQTFDNIHNLRILAYLSLAMTIAGYLFYLFLDFSFFFKVYFWLGLFYYFSAYSSWSKKFSKADLSYEDKELVKKEKTISLSIFLFSVLLGTIIYIFLLK